MRNSRKAFLSLAAAAAATSSLLAAPVRAGETVSDEAASTLAALPSAAATPAEPQDTLISQSVIVDEAVVYEQGTGFYGTIGIGGSWANDITGNVNRRNRPNRNVELETNGGFSLDAGVGYDFGAIRTELTYVYNQIGVDDITRNRNWTSTRTNGGNQNGIMASAYWDINTGTRWTPYIGGGIGWINQSMGNNTLEKTRNGNVVNRINTGSGSDDLFGWQAKAGVAYGVNWNTDIYAEAVYQGAESFRAGRTSYEALNNNWGFKIGARYRFGGPVVEEVVEETVITPAPAPAPRPQPAPAPVFQPEPAPIRGLW
jgi:opacity protein-like surface antigen